MKAGLVPAGAATHGGDPREYLSDIEHQSSLRHRQERDLEARPTWTRLNGQPRPPRRSCGDVPGSVLASFALTIPVAVWAPMIQEWLGYTAPVFPGRLARAGAGQGDLPLRRLAVRDRWSR